MLFAVYYRLLPKKHNPHSQQGTVRRAKRVSRPIATLRHLGQTISMEKVIILFAQVHLNITLSKLYLNAVKTEEKRIKGSRGMLVRLRAVSRQGIELNRQLKSLPCVYRADQRGSDFAHARQ